MTGGTLFAPGSKKNQQRMIYGYVLHAVGSQRARTLLKRMLENHLLQPLTSLLPLAEAPQGSHLGCALAAKHVMQVNQAYAVILGKFSYWKIVPIGLL